MENNSEKSFEQRRKKFLENLSNVDISYINKARREDMKAFHRDSETLKNDWINIGKDFPIR